MYLHDVKGLAKTYDPIELTEGEERIAIQDTRGFTSIAGGYFPGLIAEDPSIVGIRYEEKRSTTRVHISGRQPGTTTVFYVNRASFGDPDKAFSDYGSEADYFRDRLASFRVTVDPQ